MRVHGILIGIAIALLIVLSVTTYGADTGVKIGDKAPDFQLGNIDGKTNIKLSDYTDKPILLVFWVSWCPHCRKEVPMLEKMAKEFKPAAINAVSVSVDDDVAKARSFVKSLSVGFPTCFAGTDAGGKAMTDYGVENVPFVLVIDKGGTVAAKFVGEIAPDKVKAEFVKLGVK